MQMRVHLESAEDPGGVVQSHELMPSSDRYQNQLCHGVRIVIENRNDLDTPALGIELASALYRLYRGEFQIEKTLGLIGAPWVLQAIKDGRDPRTIVQSWQTSLAEFRPLRAKYLLYPSPQP
jgi:uncharacterized protein YbbC (DUF1343 family)